ncbi:inorganic triphosphatase [soil metagenome]
MQETELKLALTREAVDALEASALLNGESTKITQRAIYFDTPDQALRAHGLSLRIRQNGHGRVQTIKGGGAGHAGLFVRPEWEMPVPDDTPVLDDSTPVSALLGDDVDRLAPAFELQVDRRTWIIRQDAAEMELVLDRGAAIAGARSTEICEAELELLSGDPAALFAFARTIAAIAPVRLGVESKAARGYRLLEAVPVAFKAQAVALDTGQTGASAFEQIANACLHHYRLNEALMLADGGPEALHQARVALRRLRSALAIFKDMLADARFLHFRSELRWLTAIFGDARNLDVLREKAGAGALHDRIEKARAIAHDQVQTALASGRTRTLMLDLAHWVAMGDWLFAPETLAARERSAVASAADQLARFKRRLRNHGGHFASLSDEARHEVRKDAKKLRYAAEFFGSLYPGKGDQRRYRKFVKGLEALQDTLGTLNDLATGHDVLAKLGLEGDTEAKAMLEGESKSQLLLSATDTIHDFKDMRKFWD